MVIIKILCDHRTVSLDQVTVMSLINHCCISHSRLQVVWLQVQDLSFYYPITANANVIFLLIIAGGLMVGIVTWYQLATNKIISCTYLSKYLWTEYVFYCSEMWLKTLLKMFWKLI